jgi:hypothetical protein
MITPPARYTGSIVNIKQGTQVRRIITDFEGGSREGTILRKYKDSTLRLVEYGPGEIYTINLQDATYFVKEHENVTDGNGSETEEEEPAANKLHLLAEAAASVH